MSIIKMLMLLFMLNVSYANAIGWLNDATGWVGDAGSNTGKWIGGAGSDAGGWVKKASSDTGDWIGEICKTPDYPKILGKECEDLGMKRAPASLVCKSVRRRF